MKFTFNWLKEFVDFGATPQKLAERFTMAGLEVESLAPLPGAGPGSQDWLFEIAVTPNRGDCLGIAGLAREVAALAGGRMKPPRVCAHAKDSSALRRVGIRIETPRLCARYSARIVDEVRVGPSPESLRCRLESCGVRAINNIVDITNYVMLETGQPLHAFDLDRLPARKIVVRTAADGRKFTTLDGIERELDPDDLLICDGAVPIALAGVMGGADSEVRAGTRAVLLESANFDSAAIRRTAKRLGLHSEASHRFERGVDPEGTVAALDRAVYLIGEYAGGKAVAGVADRYPRKPKIAQVWVRDERIEKLLGVPVDGRVAEKLLRSLGLEARREPKRRRTRVASSARRPDLTREADLIEEIARLYGYDKIPTTLPPLRAGGRRDDRLALERRLRSFLGGAGFFEVINLPFATEGDNRCFTGLWDGSPAPVAVLNPLVKENSQMRLSLMPGLIENLRLNLARKAESFRSYHIGKTFRSEAGEASVERECLAGALFGARPRHGLQFADAAVPGFLECKGLVEGIFDLLHVTEPATWSVEETAVFHPGRSAGFYMAGRKMGILGQIHPDFAQRSGLPAFFLFELDLEGVLQYAPRQIVARSLPRFPSVERDFAVVVDRAFSSRQILELIRNRGEPLIEDANVFDQYVGPSIPEGKKSLAYRISYRAQDRTLTDSEVNGLHQALVEEIGRIFDAQLRS